MIFIYLLLIFSIGPNILYLLNKCGIISLKKLNNYEIISTSMLLSLLTFVLYLYIVGMMSIKYTNILVTSFLMINVASLNLRMRLACGKFYKLLNRNIQA